MSDTGVIGIKLIDIEQVMAFVRDLEHVEQQKAVKEGLDKGSGIFISGGKRRLRQFPHGGVKSGALMSSFTNRVKKHKLGALAGFSMPEGSGSWLHDMGTIQRFTKKGYNRGILPARYFWKETKEQDSDAAVDAVWMGVKTAVERMKGKRNG